MLDLLARPKSLVVVMALVLAASLWVLPSGPGAGGDTAFAADARTKQVASLRKKIWRPNGTVEALLRTRTRVYMGGDFTRMLSPGKRHKVVRVRIAAVNASTGHLVGKFRARANGTVRTMAVFDGHLYVGGDFTQVNGRPRRHFAALSLRTGRLVGNWSTQVDGPVLALLPMAGRLYVGGKFGHVGEFPHDKLFALGEDGQPVAGWPALEATGTNGGAYVLAASPDRTQVIVGGAFHTLGGEPRTFLGSIATDGQVTSWAPPPACTSNCFVKSLVVGSTRVFAGLAGPGGRARAYQLSDGAIVWSVRTSGDVTALARTGKRLLLGGHFKLVAHRLHPMVAELRSSNGAVVKRRFETSGHRYPGVLAINVRGRVALLAGAFEDVARQRHLAVISP